MDKSDVKEIRKIVRTKENDIDWLYGIYVNAENEVLWENVERFGNLEEAERFRHMNIFAKNLGGHLGKDIFPVSLASQQEALLVMRSMDGSFVEDFASFRDNLLATHVHTDPYYACLARIAYDVPKKASDGARLEDGDMFYEALIFAICPASLSKPSLGFDEDRVAELPRRWTIGNPMIGFLYPSFDNRMEDRNEALLHAPNPDQEEILRNIFDIAGTPPVSSKDQKTLFTELIGRMDVDVEDAAYLSEIIVEKAAEEDAKPQLEKEDIRSIARSAGVKVDETFDEAFEETIGGTPLALSSIVDSYVTVKTDTTTIKVKTDKSSLIKTRNIDGIDYILIPANGTILVNGVPVVAVKEEDRKKKEYDEDNSDFDSYLKKETSTPRPEFTSGRAPKAEDETEVKTEDETEDTEDYMDYMALGGDELPL